MKSVFSFISACLLLVVFSTSSFALSVLGTNQNFRDYGYGGSDWTYMTTALDTATENHFNTVTSFDDYDNMLTYDAIWLDVRGTSSTLGPTEYNNILNFISTGRRVVMIGDNNHWQDWDSQIVGLGGGTYSNQYSGPTSRIATNELTNEAPSIFLNSGGYAATGGTSLYDVSFATLWGSNVLTVLDVNVFSDGGWSSQNNGIFATNVASWVANSGSEPVPEPATFLLLGSGLAGLAFYRRKRK